MGRRIEFDREEAVANATDLFWKLGYTNASMSQLLKVMKLGEGSFYNAFKSKKALYMECVGHYNRVAMSERIATLKSDRSVRERLDDFFDVVADEMATNKNPGCLFSNSLSHDLWSQKDFKEYAEKNIRGFVGFLTELVHDGQTRGEIKNQAEACLLAKIIFTHLHGVHRLSLCDYNPERQRAETKLFLESLLD